MAGFGARAYGQAGDGDLRHVFRCLDKDTKKFDHFWRCGCFYDRGRWRSSASRRINKWLSWSFSIDGSPVLTQRTTGVPEGKCGKIAHFNSREINGVAMTTVERVLWCLRSAWLLVLSAS